MFLPPFGAQMRFYLPGRARVCGGIDRGPRGHRVLQRASGQGAGGIGVQAGYDLRRNETQFRL